MNERERFVACVLGEPVDRPPYWLNWSPWKTTWQRWKAEGMPAEFADFRDVQAHFGSESPPMSVNVNCGPCPEIEQVILEEDDEFVIHIDRWGIKRRDFKGHTSMSEFLEFPIKTRADWEAFRRERLDPDDPRRLDGDWRAKYAERVAMGLPIRIGWYPFAGVFGPVRWLLGDEECLLAFYTDPGLVHEIMEHMTELYLTVWGKVVAEISPDVIHLWEDMCGRQGPLISPAHFEEFMGPCYRRIKEFARAHDIPIISVDTDGKPDLIIPPMMAGGVNYLYPMEVAAGCDVNVLRTKFPRLAMMGGIDKRVLARDRQAIDRELDRVRPAIEAGRYIPALDHLVPDDVSWANYSYYAERLRQLLGKE